MRITEITAEIEGVPICPVSVQLAEPITAIIGPNESGKSTILDVIDLVTQGPRGRRWPVLGDTPGDLVAGLTLDSGDGETTATRSRRRGTHYLDVGGVGKTRTGGGRLTDGQDEMDRIMGPAYRFSMSELEDMSPAAALAWLESVLGGGEADLWEDVRDHWPMVESVLARTVDHVSPFTSDHLSALLGQLREADTQANRDALRLRRVCEQHDHDSQRLGLPAGTVEDWRAKRREWAEQLGGVQERLGAVEQSIGEGQRLEQQVADLRSRVDAGRAVDLSQLQRELDERRTRAADQHAALESTHADADAEMARATDDRDRACEAERAAAREVEGAREHLQQLAARLARLEAEPITCPECGAPVSGHLSQRVQDEISSQREVIAAAEQRARAAAEDSAPLKLAAVQADRRLKTLTAAIAQSFAGLSRMDREHEADMAQARATVADGTEAARELERAQDSIARLPSTSEAPELREQAQALSDLIREADASADALSDDAQRRAQVETHRREWSDALDRRDSARDLLRSLGPAGVQGMAMARTVAPLAEQVTRYLRPVTGAELTVGTEGGMVLGFSRGGEHCPLSEASRSHRAVILSILGTVLASRVGDGDGYRLVRADNAECMGQERRSRYVEALRAMAADGLLDQAIVCSVDDGWEPDTIGIVHL